MRKRSTIRMAEELCDILMNNPLILGPTSCTNEEMNVKSHLLWSLTTIIEPEHDKGVIVVSWMMAFLFTVLIGFIILLVLT